MTMRIEEVKARVAKHHQLKADCEKSMFKLKARLHTMETYLSVHEARIKSDLIWLEGKGNGND